MSVGHDSYPCDGEVCSEMTYPHCYTVSTGAHWSHTIMSGCCWGTWGYYKRELNSHLYGHLPFRISERDSSEPFALACGVGGNSEEELYQFRTLQEWQKFWNEDHHKKHGPHLVMVRSYVVKRGTDDWWNSYHLRLEDCCMRFWRLTSDGPRHRTDNVYWDSDYRIQIPGYTRYSSELITSDFLLPVQGEPEIREVERNNGRKTK